jgi:hypothetical protein
MSGKRRLKRGDYVFYINSSNHHAPCGRVTRVAKDGTWADVDWSYCGYHRIPVSEIGTFEQIYGLGEWKGKALRREGKTK